MYVGLKDNSFCPPLMFNIKHLLGHSTLIFYLIFLRKEKNVNLVWESNLKKKKEANTIDCKLLNMLPLI